MIKVEAAVDGKVVLGPRTEVAKEREMEIYKEEKERLKGSHIRGRVGKCSLEGR